ncbi:FRG domain-containing protein [Enterobacter cloacae]|uniref:FRG domain-containing protein n=1 Tax=Enterobacter cloacae TaxID=550 RepID=UPI002B1F6A19|nr:FRG domain-containing protein [Enterobacter cloacae]MEA5214884.1 FRG domain-containing protein [Enterobacter cloacae]
MVENNITCVGDLLRIVNKITTLSKGAQLYFRGQSDSNWGVESSLCRLLNSNNIKPHPVQNMSSGQALKISQSKLATELFKTFKDKFVLYSEMNIIKDYKLNDIDLHVMAQHYELPTRVVDLTRNPLVSLYFATEKCKEGKDVSVFILKGGYTELSSSTFEERWHRSHKKYYDFYQSIRPYVRENSPFESLDKALNILKTYENELWDLNEELLLCEDNIHPDYTSLLFRLGVVNETYLVNALNTISKEDGFNFRQSHSAARIYNEKLQVIAPLPINQRLKNQQGLLLFSPFIDQPVYAPDYFVADNTVSTTECDLKSIESYDCLKIKIKYEYVKPIKDELERYGISRDFIYPELPNYTAYMKDKILKSYVI